MNLVKRSLYLAIGVLLGLITLIGMQSLWSTHRLSQAADLATASSSLSTQARKLWSDFIELETVWNQAMAYTDPAEIERQRQQFEARRVDLQTVLTAVMTDMQRVQEGLDGEARTTLAADTQTVSDGLAAWLALATPHLSEGVTELPSNHRLDTAHTALQHALGQLVEHSQQAATAAATSSQALARRNQISTLVELVLAVSVGLALGLHAMRSLHRQLGADASEVARITQAIAGGDLSQHLHTAGVPEGSVMATTAQMQQALAQTVQQVRAVSAQLAHGVQEIAAGNHDLSLRTEQQAAAIERSASTMEELGSTVKHNASHAHHACELAEQASQVAERGGDVVGRAVETMRGINDSSRKIADIIGVIDGIAFQTNILALNAAVEAARAGEQGRGFAVVAAEVRSLAQRSASAAREIKGLINSSVERVEQGSTLVEQAGTTMQDILAAMGRVTAVMNNISQASAEQSTGVGQAAQSIAELDRATQQNAALAEQSAAAAESLKAQGEALLQAVAFFKVQGHQPVTPRAAASVH